MGSSVLGEIVTLIRDHPYISCFFLVFLTPPFWPVLMYFSPLLISTALFLVALITMGPQFEEEDEPPPLEHEDHHRMTPIEDDEQRAPPRRRVATTEDSSYRKPSKGVGDWVSSWKDSGLMWVEHKLQNKNWRGASLTDENVSILQEAFAHRVEAKPVMVKLMTRRIPAEEDEDHTSRDLRTRDLDLHSRDLHTRDLDLHSRDLHTRDLDLHSRDLHTRDLQSHSGSWNSSFRARSSSPTQDIPHDFFAPHRSLSRRLDSSDASLFENVEPPPIEHDMPPQITGPASVTAPLLKYIEDGSDSEDYDHHHHDEHLEFGERSLDAESISQDELSLANGTYGQPPPFTVREEDLPSSGSSDEGRQFFAELHHHGTTASEIESLPPSEDQVHTRDLDVHEVVSAPPPVEIVQHEEAPHEEPPPPPPPPEAPHEEEPPHVADELHDIPELEDVAPPSEVETREIEAPTAAEHETLEKAPAPEYETSEEAPAAAAAAPDHETSEAPRATSWKQEALAALAADSALEHETSEAPPAAHEHEVLEAPPEHEILEEAPAAAHEHEILEPPAAAAAHEPEILEAPAAAARELHEVFEAPEHEAPAALEVLEDFPPATHEHEIFEAPAAAPEHEPSEAPAPAAVDEHHAHEEPEVSAEEVSKDLEVPHVAFAPEPEIAPAPVHVRDYSMERSMSMPVAGSLETAVSMEPENEAHGEEALAPVPEPRSLLSNAISLPSGSNSMHPLIIPPKTSEQQQGPLSPDTDLGYATTPDHDRTRALAGRFFAPERYNSITSMSGDESEVAIPSKILSAQERLSKLEALSNSMPLSGEVSGRRDVSILRATTDEQITHVSDKLRAYKQDSSSKRFQPDAPQLQITPPSTRVIFNGPPSKSALLSQTIGRPSIRQVSKFAEKYVSSSSDSSSEEIELDSDGAADGSDSDSDFESVPVKPPPKPPQGKKTEPVKK